MIIVFSFSTWVHAKGPVANHTSNAHNLMDNQILALDSIDPLVDNLFDRALTASLVHHTHLEKATLGKSSHPAIRSRASTRSFLALRSSSPFHDKSQFAPSSSISPCVRYQLQLHKKVTVGHCSQATIMPATSRLLVQASGSSGSDDDKPGEMDDDDLPPVLKHDARDFRARLVAAERSEVGTTDGESVGIASGWMYETTLLEQGSILLEATTFGFALQQQYFHKCVILVLSHEQRFTKGIILNRPTALQLDGWPVWFGGELESGGLFRPSYLLSSRQQRAAVGGRPSLDVTCLHQLDSVSIKNMSTRVMQNLYNISFDNAKILVAQGKAKKEDFWVFVGYAGWTPRQLQIELERKSWYLAAADSALLLDELLKQASDPLSLPRVDAGTGKLLAGGDGLSTWERLTANIGRKNNIEGEFADSMLREWVLAFLTEAEQKKEELIWDELPLFKYGIPLDTGTVLVSSSPRPFLLEKQYLHKAVIIVLQKTEDSILAAVLNRPRISAFSFTLPGQGPNAGNQVQKRASFGGEFKPEPVFGGNILPLHHNRSLGGTELGGSGVFLANRDFTGEAKDLLLVNGLLAWAPPADLQRQVEEGTFTIVPHGKVPWKQIWELADASAMHSNSLEERIADVRRSEEEEFGELEVLRDRSVRLANRSCEVWERVISEMDGVKLETNKWERQLADEALFEWVRNARHLAKIK